jgi:hypothetical protein
MDVAFVDQVCKKQCMDNLKASYGLYHDLNNEVGSLLHITKSLAVEVLLTPKCHVELAEYAPGWRKA